MIVLGLDTCLAACSVAVIDGEGRASMDDHGVAERAAVYAAMCDGIDDPETLLVRHQLPVEAAASVAPRPAAP